MDGYDLSIMCSFYALLTKDEEYYILK